MFGGELIRQMDASGTLTVFGTFYEGIDVSVAASLSPVDAEARLAARGGRPFGSRGGPELVVLPFEAGGYRLAYRIRAFFERSFEMCAPDGIVELFGHAAGDPSPPSSGSSSSCRRPTGAGDWPL